MYSGDAGAENILKIPLDFDPGTGILVLVLIILFYLRKVL